MQVDVSNELQAHHFSSWVVLKRFQEFFDLDAKLRAWLDEQQPDLLQYLPALPPREFKVFVDHLDPTFIEKRRILIQSYLRVLIALPVVRTSVILLEFLGV